MKLFPIINELKIATKNRGVVRFGDVMNYAQRELIEECERQLAASGRIRIIVLKARQIGISTAIEAVMFALTLLNDRFKALIVSHEKDSAEHLLSITRTYWDTFVFKEFHTEQYNGRTHLAWLENKSGIQIVTAKNVEGGRSRTIHALHGSEVAMWERAYELMSGLNNSIPSFGSIIFLESTAKGIGGFFHDTWLGAVKGDSEYTPMFFPWHKHPEYTFEQLPPDAQGKYAELLDPDEEERMLMAMGIGTERLLWRRWCIANNCQGSVDIFHQEYPTTPSEAFLSTGTNVFKLPVLARHYQPVTNARRGRLIQVGNKVQFVEAPDGELTIYRNPGKDQLYVIGADCTWTLAGDYAVAQVLNRRTLEQVAVFRRKVNPVDFAADLYLLGIHFNRALIAPEKEGPGYGTIGALLTLNYPNVYRGPKLDHTPGKLTGDQYGWGTNKQTKPLALSHVVNALSQPLEQMGAVTYGLLLHDPITFDEMQNYVTDGKGGYCNSNGAPNDDTVMSLGIAVAVNAILPPPFEDAPGVAIPRDAVPLQDLASVPAIRELVGAAMNQIRARGDDGSRAWDEWDDE